LSEYGDSQIVLYIIMLSICRFISMVLLWDFSTCLDIDLTTC